MAKHLEPNWASQNRTKIEQKGMALISGMLTSATPLEWVLDSNLASSYIVKHLTLNNVPFKVLNMGAGVKKITTAVDTCPKCHGTGKC